MDEALLAAAEQGDVQEVVSLLKQGANPDALRLVGHDVYEAEEMEFFEWTTPIALAAQNGHLDVVKALWERGADIDDIGRPRTRDESYDRPVIHAMRGGYMNIVRFLQERGAAIVPECLKIAVKRQEDPLIDEITNWLEPEIVLPVLLDCAQRADNAGLRRLLRRGIDPNTHYNYGSTYWYDNTLLTDAVHRGDTERVHLLLEYGADVGYTTSNGFSALDVALYRAEQATQDKEIVTLRPTFLAMVEFFRNAGAPENEFYVFTYPPKRKANR